jgi:hypothetical protein
MEMIWTYLGLARQSNEWRKRRNPEQSRGIQAYAAKQEAIWSDFASRAWTEFGVQGILNRLRETIGKVNTKIV